MNGRIEHGIKNGFSCMCRRVTLSVAIPMLTLMVLNSTIALDSTTALGQAPRALDRGVLPNDVRLGPLKDLDGYFPFDPPANARQWQIRAATLRRQLLVALGLWPMPTKTDLNPVVYGKIDQGDYTVAKVYFESVPGFYVTGNLYEPKNLEGKAPGVLCPHGHWSGGRFYDAGEQAAAELIEAGGEKFEAGARNHIQARSVHLARMGCVVFQYDMIGYADNIQLPIELTHRFAKQRADMNRKQNWGLFSPQAESHLQSVMGLQAYNSIRALDFLESLPEVDSSRLAVTGASGGGTQTFILAALDSRITTAFPAVMVSTAMQGGCTCENCSVLRVGTGNVEIAGLFAPKPMAMTAANDWTRELSTKGFPELQRLYDMLGAAENIDLTSRTEFKHNFNFIGRTAMYQWFNQHLALDADTAEKDFIRLAPEQLTVWDEQHPKPEEGDDFERELIAYLHNDAQLQLAEAAPRSRESLKTFRRLYGGGFEALIRRGLQKTADLEFGQKKKVDHGTYMSIAGILENRKYEEAVPLLFLYPAQWNSRAVIWLTDEGKSGLYDASGELKPEVKLLLDRQYCVVGIDLLYQGEFLENDMPLTHTRRVDNPREAAAYTFGYNDAVLVQRTHDVLSLISFVMNHEYPTDSIVLIGLDSTAPIAAAARFQAQDAVDLLAIDTHGFRFADVDDLHSVNFMPGGAKYGDLPGLLALSSPDPVWLTGEGKRAPRIIRQAFRAADAVDQLTYVADPDQPLREILEWLDSHPDE